MGILLVILGFLFIFFVLGYLLSILLNIKRNRIVISIGISICVITLISIILGFIGILNKGFLWGIILILFLTFSFFLKDKLRENFKEDLKFLKKNHKKILLFVLFLAILFFINFSIHLPNHAIYSNVHPVFSEPYNFPYHADEWAHLSQITYSMDTGKNSFVNPYYDYLPTHYNFEFGFHSFSAAFFLITGLDAINFYQYMASIFVVIAAFLLFIFIKRLTKSNLSSILTCLFFVFLPSSINFLGNWFYVPMSMSIFLFPLFLILLSDFKENPKYIFLLGLVLISGLVIYPFVAILMGLIFLFYLFENKIIWIKLKKELVILVSLIILILLIIVILFGFKKMFSSLVFGVEWSNLGNLYSILSFMGIPFVILSLLGLPLLFKYKKSLFYIFGLICLNISLFYVLGMAFMISYRASVYYLLLFSALTVSIFFGFWYNRFKEKAIHKNFVKIFLIVFLIILILTTLYFPYDMNKKEARKVQKYLIEEEYISLKELSLTYNGERFMVSLQESIPFYTVSKNYVLSVLSSNLGGGPSKEVQEFFLKSTCERKKEILDRLKTYLVYSKEDFGCDFLVEESENVYRYII